MKIKVVLLNTGKIYDSVSEASKDTNISLAHIYNCINGCINYAGKKDNNGLVWKKKQEYDLMSEDEITKLLHKTSDISSPKRKRVVLLNTGELFNSIKEVSDIFNLHRSNISSCCNGRLKSTGCNQFGDKYIWMFEEEYNKLDSKQVSQIINKVNIRAISNEK